MPGTTSRCLNLCCAVEPPDLVDSEERIGSTFNLALPFVDINKTTAVIYS